MRVKLLPPDGHIAVPTGSQTAALAALGLYTACKRRASLLQAASWHLVRLLGPSALPGRTVEWRPPIDDATWSQLMNRFHSELGAFDTFALHLRRPPGRAGFAILLLDGDNARAFVKVRRSGANRLDIERTTLDALVRNEISFIAPTVLASGTTDGWDYLALSALPPGIHDMIVQPPLVEIVEEVREALSSSLERPAGVPSDWTPMHGDFTPWNLRFVRDQGIALFDWEDSGWGPADADLVWYDAVCAVAGIPSRHAPVRHSEDAIRFWLARLRHHHEPGGTSLQADALRVMEQWLPN